MIASPRRRGRRRRRGLATPGPSRRGVSAGIPCHRSTPGRLRSRRAARRLRRWSPRRLRTHAVHAGAPALCHCSLEQRYRTEPPATSRRPLFRLPRTRRRSNAARRWSVVRVGPARLPCVEAQGDVSLRRRVGREPRARGGEGHGLHEPSSDFVGAVGPSPGDLSEEGLPVAQAERAIEATRVVRNQGRFAAPGGWVQAPVGDFGSAEGVVNR